MRYKRMAEEASPLDNDFETKDASLIMDAPTTSKKRKEQSPTKNLKVIAPIHLEYTASGQPCGKWRRQYGKQVGLCIRKISILHAWNEVPEGLKNSLWNDTVVSNFTIFIHLVSL